MALNLSGRRPRASSPSPWHAIAAALTLISVPAAGGIQAAGLDPSAPSVPLGHYTTSWLGNSYGGPNWVQRYCNDLYTAPDGTCYGATAWDEGGREFGIYRNGQVVGKADMSHGWGYGGGSAVTANSHYMFVAQTVSHLGNNPDDKTYPPKGSSWFGIGRRHLDGSAAPFPGGEGHTATADGGPFLAMNTVAVPLAAGAPSPGITSLAASETQVFAANPVDGQIDIFNAETMAKSGEFALANVKHIAFDPAPCGPGSKAPARRGLATSISREDRPDRIFHSPPAPCLRPSAWRQVTNSWWRTRDQRSRFSSSRMWILIRAFREHSASKVAF